MKKKVNGLAGFFKARQKLLLKMKLISILLFACLMQVSAKSYLQSEKFSIETENKRIIDVLKEIEQNSEIRFIYQREQVDVERKTEININDNTVDEILSALFKNSEITYELLNDNLIFLKKQSEDAKKDGLTPQEKTISGKVTDQQNEPLPGVTVVIKGTTKGTVTNIDGEFSLTGISENAVLVFSFVGMSSKEITVGSQTTVNITMEVDAIGLEEVVAIGYGTAKKSDLTGAITQVKAEELKKFSPTNVSDMLRTTVPGLNVGYSTSAKGNSSYEIRGETTLTAGASPLFVVDGVIFNGDLSDINPDDIETMDVLKDASSAAVYGSRATNGVIVITTKRGSSDKPTINFNSSIGLATAANRIKPYDADGFIQWRSDMFESVFSATLPSSEWSPFDDPRLIDEQYLDDWLAYHSTNEENMVDAWLAGLRMTGIEIENYKAGKSVDWEDHIYHNGLRQDYNLSLSGKKEDFSYYWSLGYMDNESLTIGDEFSTIRSRINIEGNATKFLKVGVNAQFSFRDESSVPVDAGQYGNLMPYGSYFTDEGDKIRLYPNDDHQAVHPLLTRTYRSRERQQYTFFPKIYSILDLPFGITYTMNFTTRLEFYHNYVHNSSEHPQWGLYGGSASRDNQIRREWQIDNIINWSRTFNEDHKFDVTLLANAEKAKSDTDGMDNRTFAPNDILGYHNMAAGALPEVSSYDQVWSADALMARLNYGFKNKYLFTLSVRRDGSSLFGYSNPRATFPASALGWVITEEDWFNPEFLNYMKIRASWGVNGNRSIPNYSALSRIASGKTLNADQNGNAETISTLVINTMQNKDLRWERTEAFNLGVDFNLFDGILSGSVEAYSMSSTDVLVNRELPTVTGFSRVYANMGEVKNKGLEFTLNSENIKHDNFEWRTGFTFSLNRNKIVSITGEKVDVVDEDGNVIGQKEPDDKGNNWFIGEGKDVIWDYNILGTWKVGEEAEAAKWNQAPGDFRLEDDGDGILTDQDKQFLGYRDPRFRWTLTNNFTIYKNFEASVVMYSLWGMQSQYNLAKHDNHTEDRRNTWDIPYWTPENQLDDFARLRSAPANGVGYNAWFDRSFIRLENIAVAYRLPKSVLNRTFIQSCRISLNVRNVALWAPNWKFGDPEGGTRTPQIFSLGLNMSI